jgi:hypothetical protein
VGERHLPASAQRHSEFSYSAGANAIVFMLFVLAGSGYILAAKLSGVSPFYVTFVPVGFMLGYALLISAARSLRLRDDQSGDNIYYMGFLFTLTSLGVSLYQFTANRAAEEIVQNFGIAIGSTITGIGLRVIFNQMRRDPVDVERIMRLELAESARRVRRELDSMVVEFGYHRRSAQQAASEAFSHVTERFDEIAAQFLTSLEDVAAKLAAPLEAASQRSADSICELSESISKQLAIRAAQISTENDALAKRADALADVLDGIVQRLGAMNTPDRVIEVSLEPMTNTLVETIDRLSGQTERQAAVLRAAVETANAATAKSIELVVKLQDEFDRAAATNNAALGTATDTIKAMMEVLDDIKKSSGTYVEVLELMLEKTDATMRTFTDVLVRTGVEAATQTDGLREVLPAIETSAHAIAMAAERISAVVDVVRSRRQPAKRETN